MATGKVRLDAGRAESFSTSAQSIGGFDRLPWPRRATPPGEDARKVMMTLEPPGIRGMSVNTRITKMRNIRLWSLVLFCSFFLFTSSIRAQEVKECTPVVYAFRHAEDFANIIALTRVGVEHADLYPVMVGYFGYAQHYCPVGWVYSMYDVNPNGSPGTTNPFQTAAPLAYDACIIRVISRTGASWLLNNIGF